MYKSEIRLYEIYISFFRSLRRSASSLSHYTTSSVSPGGGPPRCDVIRLGASENNRLLCAAAAPRIPAYKQPEYVPKLEHVRELVSAYNEQIQKRQHHHPPAAYAPLALTSPLPPEQMIEEPIYVNIL